MSNHKFRFLCKSTQQAGKVVCCFVSFHVTSVVVAARFMSFVAVASPVLLAVRESESFHETLEDLDVYLGHMSSVLDFWHKNARFLFFTLAFYRDYCNVAAKGWRKVNMKEHIGRKYAKLWQGNESNKHLPGEARGSSCNTHTHARRSNGSR